MICLKYAIRIYRKHNMSSFLQNYKRQPKIYIDLPMSKYYESGTVIDDQMVSLPVYGMTASDEIMLKTPDALFNGEATKSVIRSCIPAIQDPGKMPVMDVDFCLIAIRLATYGETLNIQVTCPSCEEKSSYDLDLQNYLEKYQGREFTELLQVDDLNFIFKPLQYNEMTAFSLENYKLQRQLVGLPEDWSQDQKDQHVKEILKQNAVMNLNLLLAHVNLIEAQGQQESSADEINDFIANSETKFYKSIKSHVESLRKEFENPSEQVVCPACEHKFTTNIPMDYSSFFAV